MVPGVQVWAVSWFMAMFLPHDFPGVYNTECPATPWVPHQTPLLQGQGSCQLLSVLVPASLSCLLEFLGHPLSPGEDARIKTTKVGSGSYTDLSCQSAVMVKVEASALKLRAPLGTR